MVGETIELLFRIQDVVIVEENSSLEKLLFRIEGVGIIVEDGEQDELLAIVVVVVGAAAADGVETMEDVETTEPLFKTYSTGPAEDVRTIEGVETMELLFKLEGIAIVEDVELWTNWYADGEGAENDAAAVAEILEF